MQSLSARDRNHLKRTHDRSVLGRGSTTTRVPSFPTFVINGKGERRGIDWGFNTWGGEVDGLYPSWEKDNRVARKFCDLVSNDVYDKRDFICRAAPSTRTARAPRSSPKPAC